MLPTAALDLLRLDIADADTLGRQGDVAAGLEVLLEFQCRTRRVYRSEQPTSVQRK
jgi:hypothetical protein